MDSGALVFGWCFTVLAAILLAGSLTIARQGLLGRPAARWTLLIFVLGGSWQLTDVYTNGAWPLYVAWMIGPLVIAAIAAECRFRAARRRRRRTQEWSSTT